MVKAPPKQKEAPKLNVLETKKEIRKVLNKVSEGNIDPMFQQLLEVVDRYCPSKFEGAQCEEFCTFYSQIFNELNINLQQNMNAILSVNCVYVTALQRLKGQAIFAIVIRSLLQIFKETVDSTEEGGVEQSNAKQKNILNCLLHFYLF